MKVVAPIVVTIFTVGPAWGQVTVTRAGSQPSSQGPAGNFKYETSSGAWSERTALAEPSWHSPAFNPMRA
jgi:hypothetical protein